MTAQSSSARAILGPLFVVKGHDAETRLRRSVSIEGGGFVLDRLHCETLPAEQVQIRYPAHLGGQPLLTVTPLDLEWRTLSREQAAETAAQLAGTWWSTVPGSHSLTQESATAYELGQMVSLLAAEGGPVAISKHVVGLVYLDEPWMFVADDTPAAWNG
ncbi:hypothetical protein [Streptomyces sp. NRRL B-24484]|uniref:hypothetical protein n=1 Tax=Streptomyces sp. NRRL B-24484 TaxID=1463833 RepID=UPI0004C055E7|nr:hypothetical protein [Streptomyces sp. NRRL B-24484]